MLTSFRPWGLRLFASTAFTAIRCSQVEKLLLPSYPGRLRQALTKVSWVRSSADSACPVMRRQSPYTRPTCWR